VITLVVLAQAILPAGCSRDTTYHGPAQEGGLFGALAASFNLGENAFALVRSRLAASPTRAAEKVAALEARRTEFVGAVNAVITQDAVQTLGPTVRAIFDLVDDGTLPRAAENVAQILESLANEPNERTLRALSALSEARGVVQVDDVLSYMARSANLVEFEEMIAAVAEILRSNDGVDDQGNPNGELRLVEGLQAFVSSGLRDYAAAAPSTATAGLLDGIAGELLAEAPVGRSGVALAGDPVWCVRVDRHGNPAAARDAQGALASPFVDRDGDGAADVNADGDPVDAQGAPISLPPFGIPGAPGRDAEGRALDPAGSGRHVYEYFDAKRTLLAHALALVGEGIRRRLHEQAWDVVESSLGPRVNDDAGTPGDPSDDFLAIPADDAVADLAWGGFELAEVDTGPRLLRALAELSRTDPVLAERLLVTTGKIIEKLRPIALRTSSAPPSQSRRLVDRMLLLGDRVFDARQSPSVGRLLFDVVHGLGRTARRLPDQLALMARYRRLAVGASGAVVLSASEPVDWSLPPTKAGEPGGENRSALHQLLDLLSDADGCRTFVWVGRPLSETIIELMAGRSAGTATTLIGFLRNPIIRGAARLVCPDIDDDLDSLEALAASGALEGFLPIAKAFVDRGETRLLVDLLATLDRDYAAVVRPYEPEVADALASGAFDSIFDALDLLVAGRGGQPVVDPVSGQRAVDVIADGIARLVDHPSGGVAARRGAVLPSRLHLVLEPLRRLEDRVLAVNGGQAIATALAYSITDLVCERAWNDAGTPADPSDDFEELANPSVGPALARLLQCAGRNVPATQAEYLSLVAASQDAATRFLAGRHCSTAIDLGGALRRCPGQDALRSASAKLLTPDPVARDDLFGALLKLLASGLETRVEAAPLRDIALFAADLLDPRSRRVVDLFDAFSRLLQADRGRTAMALIRNALNDAPAGRGLPPGTSPAEAMLSIAEDIRRAGTAPGGGTTAGDALADLRALVQAAVAFLRDRQSGAPWLFDVIRNRPTT
jgi:hypothetical protein